MNIQNISAKINQVIAQRSQYLPQIQSELKRIETLRGELKELESALVDLAHHPNASPELLQVIDSFSAANYRSQFIGAIDSLTVAEQRLRRKTLNIGVSGQARMGKSTLLQKIAGLTDEQVPTGSGLPVTAVRSKILHSQQAPHAILSLHSEASFVQEIVGSYHQALRLEPTPRTFQEFKRYPYQAPPANTNPLSHEVILERLIHMQRSIPQFSEHLTGSTLKVALDNLRPWITYPKRAEIEAGAADSRYLAVKEATIFCTFPHAQVEGLTVIDMPGLGELDPTAEEHHVQGLRNEVDYVLLVKRPLEGFAFWKNEDARAADLLDRVRGDIRQRSDLTGIAINTGGAGVTSELLDSVRGDIQRKANNGVQGSNYMVYECDNADVDSVQIHLLDPVLNHLAERLPVMDREVVEGAQRSARSLCQAIGAEIDRVIKGILALTPVSASTLQSIVDKSERMREDFAVSLTRVVDEMRELARDGASHDAEIYDRVTEISKELDAWTKEGMGCGVEAWRKKADDALSVHRTSAPFATDELHRARVHISDAFCSVDDLLAVRVDQLWERIAQALRACTGSLLDGTQGAETLRRLAQLLGEAHTPCPSLQSALHDLLDLEISYRTHFHPQVRKSMDGLQTFIIDSEGNRRDTIVALPPAPDSSQRLFLMLSRCAAQTAFQAQKAIQEQLHLPILVLYAAAEHFEDVAVRSGDAKKEFLALTESYRNEIWPELFSGLDSQNACVSRVRKASQNIQSILKEA